jgi:hypothetical protein
MAADRMAEQAITHSSPPGTTLWRSECLFCTYVWWDYEPEPRHTETCPVATYRALLAAGPGLGASIMAFVESVGDFLEARREAVINEGNVVTVTEIELLDAYRALGAGRADGS